MSAGRQLLGIGRADSGPDPVLLLEEGLDVEH